MTYAEAFQKLIDYFVANGWTPSKPTLKVRHVTSPDKTLRFWFKPQSLHTTVTGEHAAATLSEDRIHAYGNARTALGYHYDIRGAKTEQLAKDLLRFNAGRSWERHLRHEHCVKCQNEGTHDGDRVMKGQE